MELATAALEKGDEGVPQLIAPELLASPVDGRPRLRISRCTACGRESFPAAEVCSECLSEDLAEAAIEGSGTLYSYSVVHAAPRHWNAPYALGYVDLPGGLRVLGQLQQPFDEIRIGDRYRLAIGVVGRTPAGAPASTYVFVPERSDA